MATVPITLTLNATADIPIGNMAYVVLTQADTDYVDITGGGTIAIPDWQTDFAPDIISPIINADIWVKNAGGWKDLGKVVPDMTFSGGLLSSIMWTLNEPNNSIIELKIRLY